MLTSLVKGLRAAITGVSEAEETDEKRELRRRIQEAEEARVRTAQVLEAYNSGRPSWESITVGKGSRDA